MPKYRTADYAIWKACERFGIRPPEVKESWEECNTWARATLIGYNQIREWEDSKYENDKLEAMIPKA